MTNIPQTKANSNNLISEKYIHNRLKKCTYHIHNHTPVYLLHMPTPVCPSQLQHSRTPT